MLGEELDPTVRQNTRRLSPRLFRYLLRDYLVILGLCIGGFLTLFLISALYDDLQDFTDRGISIFVASRYFIFLLPDFMVSIIPMALLLGAMYTVANLSKNNELTAIRASGISILQATLPIFATALVFTVLQFFLVEYISPAAHEEAIAFKHRLTENGEVELQHRPEYVAYRSKEYQRDWLFGDFVEDGVSKDIVITQFREDGTVEWELRAGEAEYADETGWVFRQAVVKQFDELGEFPVGAPQRVERLVREDLPEDPRSVGFTFLLGPVQSLTLREMRQVLRDDAERLSPGNKAIIKTQFYYGLSMPVSCMIAVLLGVPLAIARQRGDIMRSFVVAAGLMVLYFVSAQLFVMLGKKEIVPPMVAGWLPAVFFICWGIQAMRSRR